MALYLIAIFILKKNMNILIIEDQKFLAENLCLYLQMRTNFDVQYVTSAQKALNLLDSQQYRLIISDLKLRDSAQGEWLRKVGQRYRGQHALIISSEPIPDNLAEEYNINIIAYFEKPFDVAELTNFIVNFYSEEVMH